MLKFCAFFARKPRCKQSYLPEWHDAFLVTASLGSP